KPLPGQLNRPALEKDRDDQDRDDVHDFDHGIDRRAGGILVRVAHGVAGDAGLVSFAVFAAVVAFLDELLGIVPGAATGGHGNAHEETGDNTADQHAAEDFGSLGQGRDKDDGEHGQQCRDDHLLEGGLGHDVDTGSELGNIG